MKQTSRKQRGKHTTTTISKQRERERDGEINKELSETHREIEKAD